MASRLQETVGRVPPCTLFYILLCIVFFIVELFVGYDPFVINAYLVLHRFQIHRIFLSTFSHLGILHILFNMISFYSINPILERKYGSVFMLYAILLFTVINGILYVLIYKLLSFIWERELYVSAAGFSGVIFSLLLVMTYVIDVDTLSIFGLFSVPRKWYAVVYLIIMSVFIPGVSFIGHLCGIISGFLFVFGYLNFLIPMHCIVAMEKGWIGQMMRKSNAFIYVPEIHEMIGSALSFSGMLSMLGRAISTVARYVWKGIVAVSLFVFDSVFPPRDEGTQSAGGDKQAMDLESSTTLTAEEIRQKRLEKLENRY